MVRAGGRQPGGEAQRSFHAVLAVSRHSNPYQSQRLYNVEAVSSIPPAPRPLYAIGCEQIPSAPNRIRTTPYQPTRSVFPLCGYNQPYQGGLQQVPRVPNDIAPIRPAAPTPPPPPGPQPALLSANTAPLVPTPPPLLISRGFLDPAAPQIPAAPGNLLPTPATRVPPPSPPFGCEPHFLDQKALCRLWQPVKAREAPLSQVVPAGFEPVPAPSAAEQRAASALRAASTSSATATIRRRRRGPRREPYKCSEEKCTYQSLDRKDFNRHRGVHSKPGPCPKGCGTMLKLQRGDNVRRHPGNTCRYRDNGAIPTAGLQRFDDNGTPVGKFYAKRSTAPARQTINRAKKS